MLNVRIALIGECMVELIKQDGEMMQGFGGDTLNTAVYLKRRLSGIPNDVAYVTGLGRDPFSDEMMAAWHAEGINTDLVSRSQSKLPGMYSVHTDEEGERAFHYWRSDSAARYWLEGMDVSALVEKLSHFNVIYLSGISLAILPIKSRETLFEGLAALKEQGCKLAFDNNFRPRLWASRAEANACHQQMLALTDIALLTFDDEQALWGDADVESTLSRTQQFGVPEIVIKRGKAPCLVYFDGVTDVVEAEPVSKVVDTTAAGDSFSAGYLAKRLQGGLPIEAAKAAHSLAGCVIQHRGAIIPQSAMPKV
ncbi:sugar kinase [Enterovibrio norvegicus]|uniref:sugar kinase n=1 Tax=Enterovibrio norvegicus TaxID=188144 RepID=UPI000C859A20|nr:sugar kinase [Enterovibrio norvegicus]PML75610.1 ketodeoxygluconokinase [Enterovibrio norvegicus]